MSGSVYVKEWHHMGLEVGNKGAGLRGRGWLKVVGAVRKLCGDREQGNEIKDGCQNKEAGGT